MLHDLMAGNLPSDPHAAVNRYTGSKLPQIMGHELSATIIEVGSEVKGFSVGQRVTVNAAIDDRHHGMDLCEFCQSGRHNCCDRIHFYGVSRLNGRMVTIDELTSQGKFPTRWFRGGDDC